MTREESIIWLENLHTAMGENQYQGLWHYEQALAETIKLLQSDKLVELPYKVDKSLGDIYKTLEEKIKSLENEINKKNKKIDELNKEIEKLKKTKKAVKYQFFDFTEVKFHRVTSDQFIVSADVYISPELHRIFKQVTFYINGNEFYIGKCEVIKGRIKAKVISSQSYDLVAAQIIAKDLLSNDIYGNIKA